MAIAARTSSIAETANRVRFEPRAPVHIRLSGESNLHRWEMFGAEIDGALETEWPLENLISIWETWRERESDVTAVIPDPDGDSHPVRIRFRVPARTLQGRYSRMQKNLLDAIRAREHPFIHYEFIELDGPPTVTQAGNTVVLDVPARGRLILAGRTNIIHHATRMHIHHFSHIDLTGSLSLNMSDFEVEPPVALLGLVRAYPDFEVEYRFPIKLQRPDGQAHSQDTDTR